MIPGAPERTLWFSTSEERREILSPWADPFVLVALLPAMAAGKDLDVRGAPVSGSLLANLQDFQEAWHAWFGYRVAAIRAEDERERPGTQGAALVAFSGGVDSSYTVLRHCRTEPGAAARHIGAAVMVHGFDLALDNIEGFKQALVRARRLLDSVDLEVIEVWTNLRTSLGELGLYWNYTFGVSTAAVLTLFAGGFRAGLIPSSGPYDPLILPWGSNPVTDPMMGSDSFAIIHDGTAATRRDKIVALSSWPEALVNLRFCYLGAVNCGRCTKCIATALLFTSLGITHRCFDDPPTERDIIANLRTDSFSPISKHYRRLALETALERGVEASWVRVLQRTVVRERYGPALRSLGSRAYQDAVNRARRLLTSSRR
jgi:hypothetical protein